MTADELTARLAADPASSGVFLDFDGTLAPIVPDPSASRLPEELRPVLAGLAGRLGLVAIVSGRPAAFLLDRVPVPGVRLLGLYGLEEALDGEVHPRPEAAEWQPAVRDAVRRLRVALDGLEGVRLEDKGLSVAVHWRHAPDRDLAAREVGLLMASLAPDTGLVREPGKLVEELRPPVEWDKGAAVTALIDELGLEAVCYLGDDLGDLPAFAAVREHGGVAVGVTHGAETPAALPEVVDVLLEADAGVSAWLRSLLDRLR